MAKIIAGVASSHVPAIGAAIDNKQTEEPYWKRVFSGFEPSKEWMAKAKAKPARSKAGKSKSEKSKSKAKRR